MSFKRCPSFQFAQPCAHRPASSPSPSPAPPRVHHPNRDLPLSVRCAAACCGSASCQSFSFFTNRLKMVGCADFCRYPRNHDKFHENLPSSARFCARCACVAAPPHPFYAPAGCVPPKSHPPPGLCVILLCCVPKPSVHNLAICCDGWIVRPSLQRQCQ